MMEVDQERSVEEMRNENWEIDDQKGDSRLVLESEADSEQSEDLGEKE